VDVDGGNVFAARVEVLHVGAPMARVHPPPPGPAAAAAAGGGGRHTGQEPSTSAIAGAAGAAGALAGPGAVRLDGYEAQTLRQLVAARRGRVQDALDGDEELSLPAVLDYLGCDDWLVDAFKAMESGDHGALGSLDSAQLRELERTKTRLQQARQEMSQRLLEERAGDCDLKAKGYLDVLVRCVCSGALAWVRFSQEVAWGAGDAGKSSVGLVVGRTARLTNLKPVASRASTPLLCAGNQTEVTLLAEAAAGEPPGVGAGSSSHSSGSSSSGGGGNAAHCALAEADLRLHTAATGPAAAPPPFHNPAPPVSRGTGPPYPSPHPPPPRQWGSGTPGSAHGTRAAATAAAAAGGGGVRSRQEVCMTLVVVGWHCEDGTSSGTLRSAALALAPPPGGAAAAAGDADVKRRLTLGGAGASPPDGPRRPASRGIAGGDTLKRKLLQPPPAPAPDFSAIARLQILALHEPSQVPSPAHPPSRTSRASLSYPPPFISLPRLRRCCCR